MFRSDQNHWPKYERASIILQLVKRVFPQAELKAAVVDNRFAAAIIIDDYVTQLDDLSPRAPIPIIATAEVRETADHKLRGVNLPF